MAEEIKKINKLIALYARVSTARQEEEGTIESQLLVLREYAETHGYKIVEEYIDEGWSGTILARPSLDQLRQDATEKIWEAILIYDPDRLARKYSYQALIIDELEEKNVEVLFVTTPPAKDDGDRLLYGVKGLFAEYERTKITERFRIGKMRKVKEGHVLVSEASYGYTYIPNSTSGKGKVHGYYEVNETEARTIRDLFDWVGNEGLTLRSVVKRLQNLGIRPRKSKRGVWTTGTIGTILKRRTYIGEAFYGRSSAIVPKNPIKIEKYRKMKKTSRKIKPEGEWISISVPALIDEDLFLRTQQKLKDNFAFCKRNKKNQYLLSGKTWCVCGIRRTGEGPQRGKYLYYRCTSRVHNFPLPSTCIEKGINAKIADELVWGKLEKLMSSTDLLMEQVTIWENGRKEKVESSKSKFTVRDLRGEIEKLHWEAERYAKAYGAGVLTIEKFKQYTLDTNAKISALETQVSQIEAKEKEMAIAPMPSKEDVSAFVRRSVEMLSSLNFERKQAIVMNVVDRIMVSGDILDVSGAISIPSESHVKINLIHSDGEDITITKELESCRVQNSPSAL